MGNLPIHSLVVFVQNNTYHIEAKNVIPLSELRRTLCSGVSVLTVKQMEKAYQLLLASKTEISTKEHAENIRVQQWNVEHGICPRCGGKWFYEMKNMESFGDAQIIQGVSLLKRIKNP